MADGFFERGVGDLPIATSGLPCSSFESYLRSQDLAEEPRETWRPPAPAFVRGDGRLADSIDLRIPGLNLWR